MTVYVSRPAEIEAMRWTDPGGDYVLANAGPLRSAEQIVAWVQNNGGEARFAARWQEQMVYTERPRVLVRTKSNGWVPCAPGEWIVKGSETFKMRGLRENEPRDVLDHYPVRDLSEVRVPLTWEPGPAAVTP